MVLTDAQIQQVTQRLNSETTKLQYKDIIAEQLDQLLSILEPARSAGVTEVFRLVLAVKGFELLCNSGPARVANPRDFQLINYLVGVQHRVSLKVIRPEKTHTVLEGEWRAEKREAVHSFLDKIEEVAREYLV